MNLIVQVFIPKHEVQRTSSIEFLYQFDKRMSDLFEDVMSLFNVASSRSMIDLRIYPACTTRDSMKQVLFNSNHSGVAIVNNIRRAATGKDYKKSYLVLSS